MISCHTKEFDILSQIRLLVLSLSQWWHFVSRSFGL